MRPGEAILITPEGEMISKQIVEGQLVPCIFEYIYLARPDSVLNDISVYEFQLNLGRRLAKQIAAKGWDIDTVVPVPDGSRPAAIEIASALNLPYREGLVKNRYVGRTFIMPSQRMREISVRRKLNAMRSVFEGKKVLLVDDSIVRGTTMTQIVNMCRAAGAYKARLLPSCSRRAPRSCVSLSACFAPRRKIVTRWLAWEHATLTFACIRSSGTRCTSRARRLP